MKVGADQLHAGDQRWRDEAQAYTQEQLIRIMEVLSTAEKDLRWNEQHRLGLEMALLKAMMRPSVSAPAAPPVAPRPNPVQQERAQAPAAPVPSPKEHSLDPKTPSDHD